MSVGCYGVYIPCFLHCREERKQQGQKEEEDCRTIGGGKDGCVDRAAKDSCVDH
jgi:hypothetical protein